MSEKSRLKPVSIALGTTFALSLAASPIVGAADNPFSVTPQSSGYMVAEGGCGEGKCGGEGGEEGKCGEGKCGEGKCGEGGGEEGKCGEGKCGS
jgi:uncharacterized low-complexity protein